MRLEVNEADPPSITFYATNGAIDVEVLRECGEKILPLLQTLVDEELHSVRFLETDSGPSVEAVFAMRALLDASIHQAVSRARDSILVLSGVRNVTEFGFPEFAGQQAIDIK